MASAKFLAIPNRVNGSEGLNGVSPSHLERRRRPRSSVQWPLLLFRNIEGGDVVETITRNLSSSGFYCLSEKAFEVGESLFCALKLPPETSDGAEGRLECRVLVVRVENDRDNQLYGIACRTQEYHVEPRTRT